MIVMLAASALFATQAVASLPGPNVAVEEQKEVAYQDLSQGLTERAIVMLEARLLQDPNDPALLINLGYAYARQGKLQRAAAAYRAAMTSETRYELETSDGKWLDSRKAARTALQSLESSAQFASLED